jgi:hypothetical protein
MDRHIGSSLYELISSTVYKETILMLHRYGKFGV